MLSIGPEILPQVPRHCAYRTQELSPTRYRTRLAITDGRMLTSPDKIIIHVDFSEEGHFCVQPKPFCTKAALRVCKIETFSALFMSLAKSARWRMLLCVRETPHWGPCARRIRWLLLSIDMHTVQDLNKLFTGRVTRIAGAFVKRVVTDDSP